MSIRFPQFLVRAAVPFALALVLTSAVAAQVSEQVILNFTGSNGNYAQSQLLRDSSGRVYGTTQFGGNGTSSCPLGSTGCGVVFELGPKAGDDALRASVAGAQTPGRKETRGLRRRFEK